jgi:glucose-6-phosphate isomerase
MKISKKDFEFGKYKLKVKRQLEKLDKENLVKRIWDRDSAVWKSGKGYDELIKNRLGWLSLPVSMKSDLDEIISFVEEIKTEGFAYAVVLGMGGSSMCPEVCRETFGTREGFLKLFVLDSTDPKTVLDIENSIDLEKTLFIVSSKSGSTIEVDSFFRYFFEKVKKIKGDDAGSRFIAITDKQTPLEATAAEKKFRKTFINPSDIGGRYSALSYFGLVPAALIGIDIQKLLRRAEAMMDDCMTIETEKNIGVMTGTIVGVIATEGRDKLTFILPGEIKSFGYWLEQLIAESTGKEGKGILPVEGEATGKPASYRGDRLFVNFTLSKEKKNEKKILKGFEKKNFPLINIELKDLYDIGGQFYLWEFATAVAGAVLEINPFDEPNVKESKDNTANVLKYFEENKKLPAEKPMADKNNIKIYLDENLFGKKLKNGKKAKQLSADGYLKFFFGQIKKEDYFALMAYIQKNKIDENLLEKIRELIRSKKKIATTLGYGPRFLHSTGQLHKGGPNEGIFLQIISSDKKDLEVPGKPYSFGILKQAQAIGDYESLIKHKRRVLRIDIGSDTIKGLKELYKRIKKVI